MRQIFKFLIGLFPTGQLNTPIMYEATNSIFGTGGITSVVEIFIPVGILMILVHISKEFLEKTSLQNIDLEQIIKMFMKVVIAFAIVTNISSLIEGMNTFSNAIYTEFTEAIDPSGLLNDILSDQGEDILNDATNIDGESKDPMDTLEETVDEEGNVEADGNQIDTAAAVLSRIIQVLGNAFLTIIITLQAYSRALNIGYKSVYAPIAVSNILGYSTNNTAVTYLKELLALFMQLPIAYVGLAFSGILLKYADEFEGITAFAVPVIYIAGGMWVARSGRISKEMFT